MIKSIDSKDISRVAAFKDIVIFALIALTAFGINALI